MIFKHFIFIDYITYNPLKNREVEFYKFQHQIIFKILQFNCYY